MLFSFIQLSLSVADLIFHWTIVIVFQPNDIWVIEVLKYLQLAILVPLILKNFLYCHYISRILIIGLEGAKDGQRNKDIRLVRVRS